MRKLILGLGLLFSGAVGYASVFDLQTTSFTSTVDNFKVISSSPCALYSICVTSSAVTGATSGAFAVFNATASNSVFMPTTTIIDTSRTQTGCYLYNVYLSSGLVYSNTGGTAARVNIQYNLWSH
jgi:hypothetical protein